MFVKNRKFSFYSNVAHSRRPSVIGGLSVITGEILDPAEDAEQEQNLYNSAQQSKSFHQVKSNMHCIVDYFALKSFYEVK